MRFAGTPRKVAILALIVAAGILLSIPVRTGDDTRTLAERAAGAAARARTQADHLRQAAADAKAAAATARAQIDELRPKAEAGAAADAKTQRLEQQVASLQTAVTQPVAALPGPPGKPGPPGATGPAGPPGATGPAAATTTSTTRPEAPTTTTSTRPAPPTTTTTCLARVGNRIRIGC